MVLLSAVITDMDKHRLFVGKKLVTRVRTIILFKRGDEASIIHSGIYGSRLHRSSKCPIPAQEQAVKYRRCRLRHGRGEGGFRKSLSCTASFREIDIRSQFREFFGWKDVEYRGVRVI
jgi:hypothetical protein